MNCSAVRRVVEGLRSVGLWFLLAVSGGDGDVSQVDEIHRASGGFKGALSSQFGSKSGDCSK
jgi:hypothetical protein